MHAALRIPVTAILVLAGMTTPASTAPPRTGSAPRPSVAFSPNGQWLAAATDRRRVAVFASADGALMADYATHDGVLALRWTPDSRQIWAADRGMGWSRPRVYPLALEGQW